MSLIKIENVSFKYNNQNIFNNINLNISSGDKIGLIGDNGVGKSTLLKCILGELQLDSGKIITKSGNNFSYLEQDLPKNIYDLTAIDALLLSLPENERSYSLWKAEIALDSIKMPEDLHCEKIKNLSGGWQRLVMIAKLNINEPELIMLDEPTNHLDLSKIYLLENWINKLEAPFIVISHDREFLDNTTNRTILLRKNELIDIKAPYSIAREEIEKTDEYHNKRRKLEEAEIKRIRQAAKRLKIWSSGNNPDMDRRANAMLTRAEQLDKKKTEVYKEEKRNLDIKTEKIRPTNFLRLENLVIRKPTGEALFKIHNNSILKGDRICILGENGVGKTQFVKTLIKHYSNKIISEEIKFNPQIKIGYFDQYLSSINEKEGIFNFIENTTNLNHQEIINELIASGFPYSEHNKNLKDFSFGQKSRLMFLVLKHAKSNFFIMDEPTNHLDIKGQEDLEDTLINKELTVLFISHDRRIIETAANKYWMIQNKKLTEIETPEEFYKTI